MLTVAEVPVDIHIGINIQDQSGNLSRVERWGGVHCQHDCVKPVASHRRLVLTVGVEVAVAVTKYAVTH